MYQAFAPTGPTILVDTTIRQVVPPSTAVICAYRIRNLAAADAWIMWQPMQVGNTTPSTFTATAPTATAPSAFTLGFGAKQTEVFTNLPVGAWFVASAGATFEVTPGEGI